MNNRHIYGRNLMVRLLCMILPGLVVLMPLSAQQPLSIPGDDTMLSDEINDDADGSLPAPSDIILPAGIPGLIHVEAEDAVSTNFAQEPTLDYSSSGQRMLQLNRFIPPGDGKPYFAEYVFLAEEAGTYDLWIAGTPPGPQDPLFSSYVSPFGYVLNEGSRADVYREDVQVAEQYSSTGFWYLADRVQLQEGVNRLRFIVDEKRRFDSKYYFFLDSFFLLQEGATIESNQTRLKLPADLNDRSIDNPYRSINDYEYLISQNPENIQGYLSLARVYSLLGDYLNALKYLNRGLAYDPENPELLLLVAKNRIWKGDVIEGLNAFDRYLGLYPDDVETIAEAAKIAAWTSRFNESYRLYNRGLEIEPGNFTLKVNLGLAYLWNGMAEKGLTVLRQALEEARDTPEKLEELASVYMSNSYPDFAVEVYRQAISDFPRLLQFRLGLSQAYLADGKLDESREVIEDISRDFGDSPVLARYIEAYQFRRGLKEQVIQEYRARLERNPDDLELRELLVQTLFWNGQREEAVQEYLNIMGNRLLGELRELDQRSTNLLAIMDELYLYRNFLTGGTARAQEYRRRLQTASREFAEVSESMARFEAERIELSALAEPKETQQQRLAALPDQLLQAGEERNRRRQHLEDLIDEAGRYLKAHSLVKERASGLEIRMDPLRMEVQEEAERLMNLSSQTGWRWNRTDTVAELTLIRQQGNILGDYLLLSLGRGSAASGLAATGDLDIPQEMQAFPEGRRLAAQLAIWRGAQSIASEYYSYRPQLVARVNEIVSDQDTPEFDVQEESAIEDIAELDRRLVAATAENRSTLDRIEAYLHEAHQLFDQRLVFAMYLYDTDTYLTRYQIGEYYLSLGMYREAARQFRSVLRIDPFNANARFRLGSVKQLDGDWSGAMSDYLQVYYADPGFENVRQLYNQLARENATSLHIQASSQADSSRWNNRMEFRLTSPVDTLLQFDALYKLEDLRLHKPPVQGEDPATASLQTLELGLPLHFRGLSAKLRPVAGITLVNRIFEDEYSDVPSPVLPENIAGAIFFYPQLGLSADTGFGAFNIAFDYRWYVLEDSFFVRRDPAWTQAASLTLNSYFGFPNEPSLNSFGTRSYVQGRYVRSGDAQPNILLTLVQDIAVSTHLADNPWTNLDFVVTGIFETSSRGAQDNYYSPLNVAVGKLGINFATWIGGLPNARVLGVMPRISFGYFGNSLGSDNAESFFLFDGALKFELTQGSGSQYLDLGTSLSLNGQGLGYFSFFAYMGLLAHFPTLLN